MFTLHEPDEAFNLVIKNDNFMISLNNMNNKTQIQNSFTSPMRIKINPPHVREKNGHNVMRAKYEGIA